MCLDILHTSLQPNIHNMKTYIHHIVKQNLIDRSHTSNKQIENNIYVIGARLKIKL